MKRYLKVFFSIIVYVFAAIGVIFTAVFIGMHFGLFNVKGSIADRNSFFTGSKNIPLPSNTPACLSTSTVCDWNATPEWLNIKSGLQKDAGIINKVALQTGIPARMIASVVVPEQTRFFTANREVFKSYFEPLKILGTMTQFSLGISGIKQDTATNIEKYANDPSSEFYPGDGIGALIAYAPNTNHDTELFNRLTDSKDHTYQYLYTALYIKEIEAQWTKAGFDISNNPAAIATLFNIGFQGSHPNATPQAAGALITTGGTQYAYGILGGDFYASNELTDIFPPVIPVH